MKFNLPPSLHVSIAFIAAVQLVSPSMMNAQVTPVLFSNASLKGDYGARCQGFEGSNSTSSALSMVATQTYEGQGGVTDLSNYAVSGGISKDANYKGNYNVNAVGTGNISLTAGQWVAGKWIPAPPAPGSPLGAPTETYDMTLSNGGKTVNWVNTSFQQDGRNLSCTIKKVGAVSSVVGNYAWVGSGYYDRALKQRVSFTGRVVLDKSGMVSGSYTTAVNGVISRAIPIVGTHSLAADKKTGTIVLKKDKNGIDDEMFFVPVDDGKELFLVSTKTGNTISSQMTKQ
jgi:hypothetical protein